MNQLSRYAQRMQHSEPELTVPLRPNTHAVATVLLFAFIGGSLLLLFALTVSVPAQAVPPLWFWLTISVTLSAMVPALVCLYYRCHARLVLTETCLRWRTWADWQRVSWDAVEDYYDLPPPPNDSTGVLMLIKTNAGPVLLNRRWPQSDDVRRWVQARATAAEVSEWGVLGQRTTETDTRTFVYPQKEFWNTLTVWFFILLVYIGLIVCWMMNSKPHAPAGSFMPRWQPGDFWGSLVETVCIAALIAGGIAIYSLPLLVFISLVPTLLDSRRRRRERITTSQSGIAFENGRRQFSAGWDEITGYFLQPSADSRSRFFRATAQSSTPSRAWRWMYVVETAQGAFEYSALLDGYEQLNEILKQHGLILQGRGIAGAGVKH